MLAVFFVLLVVIFLIEVNKGEGYFTTAEESDVVFIVQGETPIKCIIGLPPGGDDSNIIKDSLEAHNIQWVDRSTSSLARLTGRYFTTWLYPLGGIHKFTIMAEGLKDGSPGKEKPGKDAPISEWVYHEEREVSSLRTRFPRPVMVDGVEMMDNFKVDNLTMHMLRVIDPYLLIFTYKAGFFKIINTIVSSALMDMAVSRTSGSRSYTYTEYVKEDKGEGSDFALEFQEKINVGLEAIGLISDSSYVHMIALSPGQETEEQSTRAEQIALNQAAAARAKADADLYVTQQQAEGQKFNTERNAEAEAYEIEVKGKAKAAVIGNMVKSLVDAGADANVATAGFLNKEIAENLPKNLSTIASNDKIFIAVSDKTKGTP